MSWSATPWRCYWPPPPLTLVYGRQTSRLEASEWKLSGLSFASSGAAHRSTTTPVAPLSRDERSQSAYVSLNCQGLKRNRKERFGVLRWYAEKLCGDKL